MLKRIDTSKQRVSRSLITLSGVDTSSYNDSGSFVMPFSEFGFFKSFNDEYEASKKIKGKELFTFLLSVIGFFFPVLKSMNGVGSAWNAWYCNKQIDLVAKGKVNDISARLQKLKERVIDLYGDGNLLEVHYNRLIQRINMYMDRAKMEKLATKKAVPGGTTSLKLYGKIGKALKDIPQPELHLPTAG